MAPRKNETDVVISGSLLVDDQMCFALYAASRAITAVYRPLLEPLGLTYPQYLVMLVLWQRESSSIKEIGTTLNLDYGTLTPLLKRLESLGLVKRTRRTDDERAVDVTLTPEGVALRKKAAHIPVEISKALGLTAKQFAELRGLLRLIGDNAAAYGGWLTNRRRPAAART